MRGWLRGGGRRGHAGGERVSYLFGVGVFVCALTLALPLHAASEDFAAGAWIIDMGVEPQSYGNGLKPYGLVHDLVINHEIPVKWAINPVKAKDGIDFTHDLQDYKGGPFIVPAEFAAAAAPIIASWTAQGVVAVQTSTPMTGIPIHETLTAFPRFVLDEDNGSIAAGYLVNSGIPSSFYRLGTPASLNSCDDVYTMPHADPEWSTHENLKTFNDDGGLIWAACHAVSVLESIDDPADAGTEPDLNFLSADGLIDFGDHDDGTLPYDYASPSHPVMQFLGALDEATENGSEQIFLPVSGGWRLTTSIFVWDPDHPEIVPPDSPGEAAVVAFGRGYGISTNGYVMYEGGHTHNKGDNPASVAAQRAYLNFVLLAGLERRPRINAVVPPLMEALEFANLDATVTDGVGPFSYEWFSTCGGSFDNPYIPDPVFTAPATDVNLDCVLRVTVRDACVHRTFEAKPALILGKPDLQLTKSDSADPVTTSGSLTYTLEVSNLGGDADVVTLTDTLPGDVTFVSVSPGAPTCTEASGTVTCALGTLAGGASSTVEITVTAPALPTTLTNSASVTHDDVDLNPANNSATEQTLVRPASDLDLVSKTASPNPVDLGERVTYTLVVRNNGPLATPTVDVSDPLPVGLSFVSASGTGWSCSYEAGPHEVSCSRDNLVAGETAPDLTIEVDSIASGDLPNTATVSSMDIVDTVPGNDSASETLEVVAEADLEIVKTVDDSGAGDGGTVNFTLTVTNNGPDDAVNVVVTDTLPYSLDEATDGPGFYDFSNFVPVQTSGPTPLVSGQQTVLTWDLGTLASGAGSVIIFRAKKEGLATAVNTASVASATADSEAGNNTDTVSVTKDVDEADLEIRKFGPPAVQPDASFFYTVSVKNNGPDRIDRGSSPFNFFTVTDTLPAGVDYVGFTAQSTTTPIPPDVTATIKAGSWSCSYDAPSRTVTCDYVLDQGADFDSGEYAYDLRINVQAPSTQGSVSNTASVSYDLADWIDNTRSNDDSTWVTEVRDLDADLGITKTVSDSGAGDGGNVDFTITVTNFGPDTVPNFVVTDTLPYSLDEATDGPGFRNFQNFVPAQTTGPTPLVAGQDTTITWDSGTLASGSSRAFTFRAVKEGIATAINTASVSADVNDPVSGNNTDTVSVTKDVDESDLEVRKFGPTAVQLDASFFYTVSVRNNGPQNFDRGDAPFNFFTITDTLPVGVDYVGFTALTTATPIPPDVTADPRAGTWGCSYDGPSRTVTCDYVLDQGADIDSGKYAYDLRINVEAPTTEGNVSNTASVSYDLADRIDNTYSNDDSTWVTEVRDLHADLGITKTVSDSGAGDGGNVDFTITVTNFGPDTVPNFVVTDTLPYSLDEATDGPGFRNFQNFVPAQTTGPTPLVVGQDTTITWDSGTLASGSSRVFTFRAVKEGVATAINTASVSADVNDPVPGNNTDSVSITKDIEEADLGILKTGPSDVVGLAPMSYTLTVKNFGPDNLDQGSAPSYNFFTVTDTLPAGMSYTGFSALATATPIPPDTGTTIKAGTWGCSYDAPSRTVTCNYVLDQGVNFDNDRYAYDLRIDVTAPASGGTIANTATVSHNFLDRIDNTHDNDDSTWETNVDGVDVDLALTIDVDEPAPAALGATVFFTITVTNNNATYPNDATQITVADPIPAGLTLVDRTVSQGSVVGDTWNLGDLTYGESATMTVEATVDTLDPVTNSAQIAGLDQDDLVPANNADSVVVDVVDADLVVTKVVDDATPELGESVTFTVTVTNDGPAAATGVLAYDQIAPGLTIVDPLTDVVVDTGSAVYDEPTRRVNWDLGPAGLADQAVATMTIVAQVDAPGDLLNTAVISASDQPDRDTDNNEASVLVEAQSADLGVTKVVDVEDPPLGGTVEFTITVTNNGPRDTTSVQVTDQLPAGLDYDSHSTVDGTYDDTTGIWEIGAVAVDATATLTLTATTSALGTLTNTATITNNDLPDPNPNDDTASVDVLSGGAADVYVTKTVDNPGPNLGETITFVVEVANDGPDVATGLEVSDSLPAGLGFVAAVSEIDGSPGGTYDDGTGIWDIGTLGVGLVATLTLQATVDQHGTHTNTATVTAMEQGDPDPVGNSASATADTGPGASISGFVWSDDDHDGVRETGETGLAGVTVALYAELDATCTSVLTAADGSFSFDDVSSGAYRIIEAAGESVPTPGSCPPVAADPVGYVASTPNLRMVTVTVVDVPEQNFGDFPGSKIEGTIFEDNGADGGTAHDGQINGAEAGIGGVEVQAKEGATVHDSTTTDGAGRFTLWLPASAATVSILTANPASHLSVSKNDGGAGDTAAADAFDEIAFVPAAGTTYDLRFGDAKEPALAPDNSSTVLPGAVVFYPHVFTAYTTGSVSLGSTATASPSSDGWSDVIYIDDNCDGAVGSGESAYTVPIAMDAGASAQLCIVVKVFVPINVTQNAQHHLELEASFSFDGTAVTTQRMRTDLTTVGDPTNAGLQLVKQVDKPAALPGETLVYTITYRNFSSEPLTTIVLHDSTPAFTSYVSAQCIAPFPASISSCQLTTEPAPGAAGSIEWTLGGTLLPGSEGQIEYQVTVDD